MKEKQEKQIKSEEMQNKKFEKGFFKKVFYSVFKVERYAEMATEGVGRAISYLMKLMLKYKMVYSTCKMNFHLFHIKKAY